MRGSRSATTREAALLGAFDGGPGIVVIAGTGSTALGRAADGALCRVGGHGYLLGDEGSGYWIGNQARTPARSRSADGTGRVRAGAGSVGVQALRLSTRRGRRGRRLRRADRPAAAGRPRARPGRRPDEAVRRAVRSRPPTRLAALVDCGAGTGSGRCRSPWSAASGTSPPVRSRFVELTGAVDPLHPPEWGALLLLDQPQPEEIA